MRMYPGYMTVPASVALSFEKYGSETCRVHEIMQAADADACAQRCLEMPFCATTTFFGSQYPTLMGRCFGRTAGPNTWSAEPTGFGVEGPNYDWASARMFSAPAQP